MNPSQVKDPTSDSTRASSSDVVSPILSTTATNTYRHIEVDGIRIFYREAGPKDAPTIVLLHGFPSSSQQFDRLIPVLATRYHVVAPDFPGFGHSDSPSPDAYAYTFDQLAKTVNALLEQLGINRYTLYLFDYGAPIGYRIILAHPERLEALTGSTGYPERQCLRGGVGGELDEDCRILG